MQGFSFTINGVGLCGNYRFYLLTPLETAMSSFDRDPSRKVSQPTEADFIHGFATSAAPNSDKTSLLLALVAGFAFGKAIRRSK